MEVRTKNQMDFVRRNFIPIKNKLLNKFSPTETHFENLLRDAHIYYVREKCNFRYNTRWSYFDYYLPYEKIYIELDGKSHDMAEQKEIDKQKLEIVRRRQAYLLRLKNEDVLSMESISIDIIKELLFNYLGSQTKRHTARHYRKRYDDVMTTEYLEAIQNMGKALNVDIDKDKEVWLYHKDMDAFFRFDNIFIAKMSTKMRVNEIARMIVEGYTYMPLRKYVFANTLNECRERVKIVYGE